MSNPTTNTTFPEVLFDDESVPMIRILETLQQYGFKVKATFDLKTSRHRIKVKRGSYSYEFTYSRLDGNPDALFRLGLETAVRILFEKELERRRKHGSD